LLPIDFFYKWDTWHGYSLGESQLMLVRSKTSLGSSLGYKSSSKILRSKVLSFVGIIIGT
jgi:hypothetical protein